MALALPRAACWPLAARPRPPGARRAAAAVCRPRPQPSQRHLPVRFSRPLRCCADERDAHADAEAQADKAPSQPPPPPPPPPAPRSLVVAPSAPTPPSPQPQPEGDERKPPNKQRNPFFAFLKSFVDPRNVLRVFVQVVLFMTVTRLLGSGMGISKPIAPTPKMVTVAYSDFLRSANGGFVSELVVGGTTVHWVNRRPSAAAGAEVAGKPAAVVQYRTTRPDDAVVPYDLLLSKGARIRAAERARWDVLSIFHAAVSALMVMLLLSTLAGRGMIPGMSSGFKDRAKGQGKRGKRDAPEVTFADVAGVDEAKEELQEVVAILKSPERFTRLGARPPTGVLLVGPPGTGKTLLAKAVAGEAGVPFFSCSASEFVELYVGVGAQRVREVFRRAKAAAPSIVFIDEIDAVAKSRSDGSMRGSNDEREQTLNQLLTELDGFDSSALVICLAATNRVDTLDAALRRPGRFDRTVAVEAPDRKGREQILDVHVRSKKVPLASDVTMADVAKDTPGFTGAELANVVNEAALLAARRGADDVDAAAFDSAVMRAIGGIERKRSLLSGFEKQLTARHEAGHAIVGAAVSMVLPADGFRTESISLVGRSNGELSSLGHARMKQTGEDRTMLFADELRGRLAMMLGGRAAEELSASGRVSAGAGNDIKRASQLAYTSIAEWGFSSAVGPLAVATLSGSDWSRSAGGATGDAVQAEVAALLKGALEAARAVLLANADLLDRLGAALEAEERVSGARLTEFLAQAQAPQQLRDYVTAPQTEALRLLLPPPKDDDPMH